MSEWLVHAVIADERLVRVRVVIGASSESDALRRIRQGTWPWWYEDDLTPAPWPTPVHIVSAEPYDEAVHG